MKGSTFCVYHYMVMERRYFIIKYLGRIFAYDLYKNKLVIPSNKVKRTISKEKFHGFLNKNNQIDENPKTILGKHKLERELSSISFQVTQGCNLGCQYCPFAQKNNIARHHNNRKLNFNQVKKALEMVCSCSMDSPFISIGFYGGEPLLNFDLIKKTVEYAEVKFFGKMIHFTITTNGTLLTKEMMSFFEAHHFQLVFSLDGPRDINDSNRYFLNKEKSVFDIVMSNLGVINKEYPDLFEHMGINMVLDPKNDLYSHERLFEEYPFLRKAKVSSSIIDDSMSDSKNIWDDKFLVKYKYKIFLIYLELIRKEELEESLILFGRHKYLTKMALKNFDLPKVDSEIYPNGMCIPGNHKLFLTVDGRFYPCEKVNEMNELYCIGDLTEGLNLNKCEKLFNFQREYHFECSDCIALNQCNLCINHFNDQNVFTNINERKKICNNNKEMFKEYLKLKYVFMNYSEYGKEEI